MLEVFIIITAQMPWIGLLINGVIGMITPVIINGVLDLFGMQ